jgi:3' terminal RNA ribose 2'-O-methyltransferase Hen1
MLLTLTTTHQPATDLGFLLHKHPERVQTIDLSIGQAHIFYPERSKERCTVALLLDIDPIDLVRGSRKLSGKGFALGQYVNDRPYVASSFLSVALGKAFSTALSGTCKPKPELVDQALPLTVEIPSLPAPSGGEGLIRRLFEPLGYAVQVQRHPLDPAFPAWGESKYYQVTLSHTLPLKELLAHLYVLIPALDGDKHYYVSQAEIEKLMRRGTGWLATHPEKDQIARRYLLNFRSLTDEALGQLRDESGGNNDPADSDDGPSARRMSLHDKRLQAALTALKASGAETVIDLGCGEGKLLQLLLREKQFRHIAGMDVSWSELNRAKDKLNYDEMAPRQKERLTLFQGALTYRDERLSGYDAAAMVEVIEHVDENRLPALERVVFALAQPQTVVVTTPNAEYNVQFEQLSVGSLRHSDHRFEWTRAQFSSWVEGVAGRHGYTWQIQPVGEAEDNVGAPSQMAIFKKKSSLAILNL